MNCNFRHHWLTGGVICALVTASSCMDNAYDLSDIDTTVRLNVKELTIPMNLDVITFDQVFDINDDSEIKKDEDENGNIIYAVKIEGDFKSDDIQVNEFIAQSPDIDPVHEVLRLTDAPSIPKRSTNTHIEISTPTITFHYPIPKMLTHVSAQSEDVDKSIKDIETLGVSTSLNVDMQIDKKLAILMDYIKIEDLQIQCPKGLGLQVMLQDHKSEYNPETGILKIQEIAPDKKDGKVHLKMKITNISFEEGKSSAGFEAGKGEDGEGHFTFNEDIGVTSGNINIYVPDHIDIDLNNIDLTTISFSVSPQMEDIHVNKFTGRIEYAVEEFNINPIELNDLPDLINQEGTSIKLANPQLYLSMSNPLKDYLTYLPVSAGFELVAERNQDKAIYTLDDGKMTTDKTNYNNQYVLSPNNPSKKQENYTDAQYVKFTDLSNILDVNDKGIPSTIKVHVIDPLINETEIKDFKLGTSLKGVSGDYLFYAPLQLQNGSTIKYEDTIDEWNDEDIDKMAISEVKLDFTATTEVPIEMELTVVPIDKEGKVIKGVESNTVKVPAKAPNKDIHFKMTGDIKHLDGVKITANLTNIGDDTALAPQMKLNVKNLKATLTGYYEDEF